MSDSKMVPEYEKPKISDYGDLKLVTAGEKTGSDLDKAFPSGTPKGDLRFSG